MPAATHGLDATEADDGSNRAQDGGGPTGGEHSCGAATDGLAYCWGDNGSTTVRLRPAALGVELDLTEADAAYGSSCGVATGGAADCWGHNYLGQLGDGTNTPSLLPTPVVAPM